MVDTLFKIDKGVVKKIIELSNHPNHKGFTKVINKPVKKIEEKKMNKLSDEEIKENKDCPH